MARPSCTRATRNQTAKLVAELADRDGISFIRTLRGKTPVRTAPDEDVRIGGSRIAHEGDDVAIIACGITLDEAVKAAERLADGGVKARVLDAYSIKPIDAEAVRAAARDCGAIVTVEDHAPEGGLGDAVLDALAEGDEQRARRQARGPRDPRLRHARGAPARREDRRRRDRRRGPEARRLARLTPLRHAPPEPGRGAAELRDAAEFHHPIGLPGGAVVVGEELLPAGGIRRDLRPRRSACGAGRLRARRRPRSVAVPSPREAALDGRVEPARAAAWRTTRCATGPSRARTGAARSPRSRP